MIGVNGANFCWVIGEVTLNRDLQREADRPGKSREEASVLGRKSPGESGQGKEGSCPCVSGLRPPHQEHQGREAECSLLNLTPLWTHLV